MKKVILFKNEGVWKACDIQEETNMYEVHNLTTEIKSNFWVFTLQVSDFINEYGKDNVRKVLPEIIDIKCFIKQFWQKSNPLENQINWNFFKFLKENDYLNKEFRIQDSLEEYLKSIRQLIEDTFLENKDEFERFKQIELPINRLIYAREKKGIRVNESIYPELIESTEKELYQKKTKLQLDYRVFSPENKRSQINILKENGISDIKGSLLSMFKSYSSSNELFKQIMDVIRLRNDLNALLYLTSAKGGKERVFPNYQGFGSITSRITLREPALQNIRKKIRNVLVPENGKVFFYVDFSQFEAGILASLSEDKKLRTLYDSDIYDDLNKNVWGGLKTRDDAKILFYKFMYGLELKEVKEREYFDRFKKLLDFKSKTEQDVLDKGKVSSSFGNSRILNKVDKTIALSHKIQSEASLIFKKGLLKVKNQFPEVDFVLPMHDAALYEIDERHPEIEIMKEKVRLCFQDTFAEFCPGINHSVKIKDFYND